MLYGAEVTLPELAETKAVSSLQPAHASFYSAEVSAALCGLSSVRSQGLLKLAFELAPTIRVMVWHQV